MNNKLFLILILSFIMNTSAFALEFSIHENNSKSLNAIKTIGTIELNDDDKLHQYLSQLTPKKHTVIYLDSRGGSLYGGMKLGRYFKDHHIKTVIQGYKSCASACALAFLGGRDYHGEKWMSSTTTSRLGFHAFSYANNKYENMDSTQKTVSDILKYGKDVGANMDIFIKLFATSSSDMYWFSTKETLDFNIKIWDIENNQFLKENSSQKIEYQEQETKIAFIERYFRELKEIAYKQSWNKLNSSMKRAVSFTKYKKWWSKSVESIQILDTQSLRDTKVKIKLLYTMTNGKKICSLDTFTLEKEVNSWLIAKQSYRGCFH